MPTVCNARKKYGNLTAKEAHEWYTEFIKLWAELNQSEDGDPYEDDLLEQVREIETLLWENGLDPYNEPEELRNL